MFFVFGIEVKDGDDNKLVPITKEIFHPNIQILSQKLMRYLYPNATANFMKELLDNQSISPIKIYPTLYMDDTSSNTNIDPLIQYLEFTGVAKTSKDITSSNLFVQQMENEITNIIDTGWKGIVKKNYQFGNNIKNRNIKINSNQSKKVLVTMVSLKHAMDKNMYVTISNESNENNSTVYDILMQNSIFFDKINLDKVKILYKIKFGYLDLETNEFESIVNFTPRELDINMKNKAQVRLLQYPYNEFIANLINSGITTMTLKTEKNILVNRKTVKIK